MRYLLLLTVVYFALGSSVVRAQVSNFGGTISTEGKGIIRSETDLIHEFEYAWRNSKMVLEFSQYDCQFSVTEENIEEALLSDHIGATIFKFEDVPSVSRARQ